MRSSCQLTSSASLIGRFSLRAPSSTGPLGTDTALAELAYKRRESASAVRREESRGRSGLVEPGRSASDERWMKIPKVDLTRPADDVLEISLFGPGYGECLVCHLGANEWLIVDSCLDQRRRIHPALEYLERLGVTAETDVKLVVATHWHDDHVRGLSDLVLACSSARFSCSTALRDSEFLEVVGRLDRPNAQTSSGLREMRRTFEILEGRGGFHPVRWAMADRPLFVRWLQPEATVTALSPSDAEYTAALQRFGLLSGEVDRGGRASSRGPNDTAVVLLIELADTAALLGADLEETTDPQTGWTVIVDSQTRPTKQAGLFKIPHHGSETAHQERVWEEMLDAPVALLTPFRRGRVRLPTQVMLDEIMKRACETYAAAAVDRTLAPRLPHRVAAAARVSATKLSELHGAVGQIQVRVDSAGVVVRLREPARQVG
jgi:Metallo-beta-lactamase superfamily